MSASNLLCSDALRAVCARLPQARLRPILEGIENPKPAAILLPVTETPDGLALIVTRRHSDLRHHSDDWVFPGGRVDPADASTAAAAIREASEELGIAESDLEMLGQLDSRGPIITGYIIDVFVALVRSGARLQPENTEVAEVATILLSSISHPENVFRRHMHSQQHDSGSTQQQALWRKPLLHFVIRPGQTLWGLQADILAELLQHLHGAPLAHLTATPGDTDRQH